MPLTYTNRKGVVYTLYRTIGKDEKPRYVFGRRGIGEPVDAMPPGFRVNESPNGIVSVARDRPSLIRQDELAAVEREMQRHPEANNYRVAGKHKRIEIYAKEDFDLVENYLDKVVAGLASPGREQQMQEFDDRYTHLSPVLCFTLIDPARRTFSAEEFSTWGGINEWLELGQTGDIAALARAIVPTLSGGALPGYTEYFLPGIAMQPTTPAGRGRKRTSASTSGRARRQPSSIHQLKVTLLGIRPPIWRRIAVSSDYSLGELHYVLQLAMGWTDSHLHDFRIGDTTYGDPVQLEELGDVDEWYALLTQVAPAARSRMRYMYDFGDGWEHELLVEKVGPPAADTRYPVCLAGKRACPPENCGGVWGYVDLLEALANPANPEYDEIREWIGGPIDAEAFDLEDINSRLARLP